MYGVLWATVVTSGPPYSTLLTACTVKKYAPSDKLRERSRPVLVQA